MTMSIPSEENPTTDMLESSIAKRQPSDYSFYLSMQPLRKFRLAIEALADLDFNDNGLGMVDVDPYGFTITVASARNACASLQLTPAGLIRFRYSNPVIGKLVDLGSISQSFPADLDGDNNDIVHVYHVLGSNELRFVCGTDPRTDVYSSEFVKNNVMIRRFPSVVTSYCEITIPTNDLRQMIDCSLLEEDPNTKTPKTVIVGATENSATFSIGKDKRFYDYEPDEVSGVTGLAPGQIRRAQFKWTYNTFLKNASFMEDEFDVCVLSDPAKSIMFRFSMQKAARQLSP